MWIHRKSKQCVVGQGHRHHGKSWLQLPSVLQQFRAEHARALEAQKMIHKYDLANYDGCAHATSAAQAT